ncbi:hypothetical protein V7O62_06305 [Methanolobus sp. ZRKC2]|uniref:GbsR/MarR family transcriptional regulator n=1 Tax=Methanolobus sp. ZRKC2 TaxID=3125783 RepID=UPI00324FE4F8
MDENEKKKAKVAKVIPSRPGDERIGKEKRCYIPLPNPEGKSLSGDYAISTKPRDEFIELISQNLKAQGFDEISSRIVGVLFIETEEMSLEEIAIETGYSLSAVSTAMKNLSHLHIVKRFKKPGSRKAFFFLDKNLVSAGTQVLRTKYEDVIIPSKKRLPDIIEKYKNENSKNSEEELRIIEHYHRQVLKLEKVVKNFLEEMEKIEQEMM